MHFQSSGEIDSGSFSLLSTVDSQISVWDPGEVKSEPLPCVTPGSAVPRISPATGAGQGERTMQELKETFMFITKRRGGQHTEVGACKSLWEAEEEAAGGWSYLLQLP